MTAATLIVALGVLAALPFRRDGRSPSADSPSKMLTGPRSETIDSVRTGRDVGLMNESSFDTSLAWQPVPMTLPERAAPELPPMPNSYYDLAFELEQPDPIRQRFSAAVQNRSERLAPATAALSPSPLPLPAETVSSPVVSSPVAPSPQTGVLASNRIRPPEPTSQPQPQPQAHAVQAAPDPSLRTAEDLIKDRFVYTPIATPKEPQVDDVPPQSRRTPAQSASLIRSGPAQASDAARPRLFIREPE